MKYIRNILSLSALGILAITLLAACGEQAPTPTPTPTPATGGSQDPTPTPTPQEQEFDAEAYFRGKTIRLMTSSNPGGGTDTQMRYIQSQISRFIPGQPRVTASNVPPHVAGKNFIYQAEPDGTNIGLFSTSMLREELFPGAEYDSARFTYIADVGESANVYVIRGDLPYQDVRDAMGKDGPVIRTMSDAPEPGNIEALLLAQMMIADFLDLPWEVVRTAERGTGPALLALERGDINSYQFGGGAWALLPAQREGWLRDGFVRPFYNMGPGRNFFPNDEVQELDVPHVYDLFTEEQRRIFIGVTEAPRNMERPLVMPPGVPDEITAALRQAFYDAFHDDEFCAGWHQVTGAQCVWTDGEQLAQLAREGQELMREYADQYERYSEEYFQRFVR